MEFISVWSEGYVRPENMPWLLLGIHWCCVIHGACNLRFLCTHLVARNDLLEKFICLLLAECNTKEVLICIIYTIIYTIWTEKPHLLTGMECKRIGRSNWFNTIGGFDWFICIGGSDWFIWISGSDWFICISVSDWLNCVSGYTKKTDPADHFLCTATSVYTFLWFHYFRLCFSLLCVFA